MVGSIQKRDGSEFEEKEWRRPGGGGGLMSLLKGEIFEKVGVKKDQLSAIAYADTRPKLPNTDETGSAIPANQGANRRVVVHVKKLSAVND